MFTEGLNGAVNCRDENILSSYGDCRGSELMREEGEEDPELCWNFSTLFYLCSGAMQRSDSVKARSVVCDAYRGEPLRR